MSRHDLSVTGDVLLQPELIDQARQDGGAAMDFFPMLARSVARRGQVLSV